MGCLVRPHLTVGQTNGLVCPESITTAGSNQGFTPSIFSPVLAVSRTIYEKNEQGKHISYLHLSISHFSSIFSSGDSLNLLLFVCNRHFFLDFSLEETVTIYSSQVLQDFAVPAAQSSGSVRAEHVRSPTGEVCHWPASAAERPKGSHAPAVFYAVTRFQALAWPEIGWWSPVMTDQLTNEALLQKECASTPRWLCRLRWLWVPSEPKLDSETWTWWFIKELEAVKQKRAKGIKGFLCLSGFVRKQGLGYLILEVPISGFLCTYCSYPFQ